MKNLLGIVSAVVLAHLPISFLNAGGVDSLTAGKRNVIKYNISSALLWGFDNFTVEFERIVNPNQSFSILAGYRTFPELTNEDSTFQINRQKDQFGFNLGADYRFYLKSKNRNNAPDGVFVGPFIYCYNTGFTNYIDINSGEAPQTQTEINTRLGVIAVGAELGYQFIIKDRLSVDFVLLGPSLSFYRGQMDLKGDPAWETDYYEKLRDLILLKHPYLVDLLEEKEINQKGITNTLSLGLKYSIRIGYVF